MFAIKSNGVGNPVGWRNVGNDPLPEGFDFLQAARPAPGAVLAGDGQSLRAPSTAEALAARKSEAERNIDIQAGMARARFPSPGSLVAEEYLQAEKAAQGFADDGYPGTVPDEVQCWADATGMSAAAAADDILATATAWRTALAAIRRQRLVGKANVDAAEDIPGVESAEAAALAALDAITPGAL